MSDVEESPELVPEAVREIEPEPPSAVEEYHPEQIAPAREERLFLALAIFIGIFSGLLVVCFRIAIEWCRLALLGSVVHPREPRLLFVPAAAGLVVAVLVQLVFPSVRGSGVNQTKAALYIYDGYVSFRTVIGKFITAALAIGAGHSLGPEDPSLQIGAGVASLFGRKLQLSRERLRLIAPIGAAAGLAAAFNAPISAVLFVIEEVIGRWSAGILGSVVLAAVASVMIVRGMLGAEPMFRIPPIQLRDFRELLAYAVLGVVGALASLLLSRCIGFLRPRLRRLPCATFYVQPAIAGFLVGCIGFFGFPQVMGAGYDVMDQAMHGEFGWKLLLILALLKIVATTLSFSSGTPGGMFAPTLFIGAMLGGAVGGFERLFFTHLTGSVGSYALVGMGVLFAGFLRVPLTSVFMVLEVSGNYSIILPVILANTIAYVVARALQPVPIFDLLTRQDGLELPSMEEQREEPVLRIEDAMQTVAVPVVQGRQTLREAWRTVAGVPGDLVFVHHADGGWSEIGRAALDQLEATAEADLPVDAVLGRHRMPPLYPDLPLDTALRHLHLWPVLPVLHRADPARVQGVLAMPDVLAAYRRSHDHGELPDSAAVVAVRH